MTRAFLFAAALAFPLLAGAIPILDKTVTWREEVDLRSGQKMLVDRSATFGPDEWFRPGRGPLKELTLAFTFQGRKVKWISGDGGRVGIEPAILDVIDGAPVLVQPVSGWHSCQAQGFPHHAFVLWGEERGKWVRLDHKRAPPDLKINLARSFRDLLREPPPKGLVVNAVWKAGVDGRRSGPRQGEALAALSRYYAESTEQPCKKIRPAPDPAADAALQRVQEVEMAAPTIAARRVSLTAEPQTVDREELRGSMGTWMQVAWVTDACRALVKQVEPRHQYSGDQHSARRELGGYTIHLASPAADTRIALAGHTPPLASIACDELGLVVVRRASADRLLVDRFDPAGRMRDATWVELPGILEASVDGKNWPVLWKIERSGSSLTFTLADYAYTRGMSDGGTLRRQATYQATLPGP